MVAITTSSSYMLEDVYKLAIRKFNKTLKLIDKKLHYNINKTASMSGFVKFKEDIPHWLSDTDKDIIESNSESYEKVQNDINVANGGAPI